MFFVFEGADGVGKTTQVKLLAEHVKKKHGLRVLCVREPGGTPLGEKVRGLLLERSSGDLGPATEMFLFMAARTHLMEGVVSPALERGEVVICDRYLWSSVVYQGIVGGLGIGEVLRVGRLAAPVQPTRTFIIDAAARVAYRRLSGTDRMECRGPEFQEKVRRAFLSLARRYPRNVVVIDGKGSIRDVHQRIVASLPERGWSACKR